MKYTSTTNGLKLPLEDWSQIKWLKVNKTVKNLRQRVFCARKLGNFRAFAKPTKVVTEKLRKPTIIGSSYHPNQSW